jgi:hypothetical protein
MPESWPDPVNVKRVADAGEFGTYAAAAVPGDGFVLYYRPDRGERYLAFQLHKRDPVTFRGLYQNYVSFRLTPPLSLRLMSGVIFIRHTNEVTLLKLGEIKDRDPGKVSNRISMIDLHTAKKRNADIDELAHVAIRCDGNADRVIDGEDVDELVCICIDFSGSMSRMLEGNTAVARKMVSDRDLRRRVVGDTQRFEYAWQYTVSLVHRFFEFRIPSLIGSLGFTTEITFETDI